MARAMGGALLAGRLAPDLVQVCVIAHSRGRRFVAATGRGYRCFRAQFGRAARVAGMRRSSGYERSVDRFPNQRGDRPAQSLRPFRGRFAYGVGKDGGR